MFTEKCKTVFSPHRRQGATKGLFQKRGVLKKWKELKNTVKALKAFFWSLRKEENYEHIEKNRMLLGRLVWPKFRI